MIYLSQLLLNPRSRMVQRETNNPYEMHRTICKAFPDSIFKKNEPSGILFRLDIHPRTGAITVLVQSTIEPDWQPLTQVGQGQYLLLQPACKAVDLQLPADRPLAFRLTANPTVKKKREGKKHSNRVPLVREENQMAWLNCKSGQHGFQVLRVDITHPRKQTSRKKSITLFTVQFNGHLQITDAEEFTKALQTGIGPAKAFGCGLLSLAPIRG
ncbi:MAG: type I-E CRISPR-associated protein Cas6/Cse3/CasE [Chloroflexi bacterium]|nr:type I-E CRISPR-associated protein Cas6/Cse3/CasE [Chloroflexota bacterium]